jgi:hypothetical protein
MRSSTKRSIIEAEFPVRQRKPVPHEFVLDALAEMQPRTNPMFGCLAVYVGEKIVLVLRDKRDGSADNGVWLATIHDHHESLRAEFPTMRSIQVFGQKSQGGKCCQRTLRISKKPHCTPAS